METTTTTATTTTSTINNLIKNKRKNFNPRCSASADESDDKINNSTTINQQQQPIFYNIPNTNFSISKTNLTTDEMSSTLDNNLVDGVATTTTESIIMSPVPSSSSTTPPPPPPQQTAETEAKFRDFAFKTMQELLNIYGLSLSPSDIVDSFKKKSIAAACTQQQQQQSTPSAMSSQSDIKLKCSELQSQLQSHLNTSSSNSLSRKNNETKSASSSPSPQAQKNDLYDGDDDEDDDDDYGMIIERDNSDNFSDSDSPRAFDLSRYNDDDSNTSDNRIISGDDENSDNCGGVDSINDGSYDSGRISLKNVESLMDKSSMGFFSPMMHLTTSFQGSGSDTTEKLLTDDYSKYLTKYQSYLDCQNDNCQIDNLRDHFHCSDAACFNKALSKKEEIIRHLKWHKKRSESLNHGFLRFSSTDDCGPQYKNCSHNRRQTHYHCVLCPKCYISTSDVQMHSNYHRKDSAIIQEGFQRFRATEECNSEHCMFSGQRTTHFHCRRDNCKYTFKNKADMEKHKSYHIKDEQLARDGFKKFLKTEACPFDSCRFSHICNHIHCIRENCEYVLHSSGQLLSHKRKHERLDSETAYRRFKMAQKLQTASTSSSPFNAKPTDLSSKSVLPTSSTLSPDLSQQNYASQQKAVDLSLIYGNSSLPSDILEQIHKQQKLLLQQADEQLDCLEDGIPKSLIPTSTFLMEKPQQMIKPQIEDIDQLISTYFTDYCNKQQSDEPLNLKNLADKQIDCFVGSSEPHLHCLLKNCNSVIPRNLNNIFEHIRNHDRGGDDEQIINQSNLLQITSIDGFFNRKRGRPPKNRVVEVYNNIQQSPQAIFTSFKLEKGKTTNNQTSSNQISSTNDGIDDQQNFLNTKIKIIQPTEACTSQSNCVYSNVLHFHCEFDEDCNFTTNNTERLERHIATHLTANETENDNFEYVERNKDCKYATCVDNMVTRHFHCKLCNASFNRLSLMQIHICDNQNYTNNNNTNPDKRHENYKQFVGSEQFLNSSEDFYHNLSSSDGGGDKTTDDIDMDTSSIVEQTEDEKISVVRAAGTYFPQNSGGNDSTNQTEMSTPIEPSNSCQRPFCKLKKKYHQHCDLCNQAFSDEMKLKIHFLKHQTTKLGQKSDDEVIPIPSSFENFETTKISKEKDEIPQDLSKVTTLPPIPQNFAENFSTNLHLAQLAFYRQNPFYYQNLYPFLGAQGLQQHMEPQPSTSAVNFPFPTFELPKVPNLTQKRKLEEYEQQQNRKLIKPNKQQNFKIFKDEPIPQGYLKFRFNEDCNFPNCGYRNHQSHFHCCRNDCYYSFCDKTRFVQHTARHERLDKLMGDDFKQYRANMQCGHVDCAYNKNMGNNNKSSHFHCLKCNFICSDTNKVVAHRRQHNKLEYIRSAGFRKVSNNEKCTTVIENDLTNGECSYSLKQTHYHCLICDLSVLSRAQLGSHRHRA